MRQQEQEHIIAYGSSNFTKQQQIQQQLQQQIAQITQATQDVQIEVETELQILWNQQQEVKKPKPTLKHKCNQTRKKR